MAKQSRKLNLPPLDISVKFLKDIGELIESDAYVDQEALSKSTLKDIYTYTLSSDDEDLSFSTIQELQATKFFPKYIRSISIRLSTYNRNDLSLYIFLNKDSLSLNHATFESHDPKKVLLFKNEIEKILDSHKTNYSLLYTYILRNLIGEFILSVILTSLTWFVSLQILSHFIKVTLNIVYLSYLIIFPLFYITYNLFFFTFPRQNFNLSENKNSRGIVIGLFIAIVISIISSFTYDILKFLKVIPWS